jgi:homogentisate 1,2-dioxygenase
MSNRHWIPVRAAQGRHSRQAHADLPAGTFEREMSKEGFFGPAAFLYHRNPPTSWIDFEGPLRPRAFDLNRAAPNTGSPWQAARVLENAALEMRAWRLSEAMPQLARNADGDELLFVHEGSGDLFCDFGRIAYEHGDYIVLPRGTMWRLAPTSATFVLMIEATNDHFMLPDRGMLGAHAVFDPALLDMPQMDEIFRAHQAVPGNYRIEIKRRGRVSTVTYPYNPLDAEGWHGDLAPVRLNVRHIRPVMSHRYHVPPSVHTTFAAERFVVCTFAPRPFETDPGAIKVPFFHNNNDYDEVLFYHAGDFFSRDHIAAGMMTFHPSGFTHGPHPKALKNIFTPKKPMTDEYAVMIDARDPLEVAEGATAFEHTEYVDSWKPTP